MISREFALKLAELYFKIRYLEKRISAEYTRGEIRCPTHLSLGQELFPSILGCLMRQEDLAISTHRGHAHYIAKQGSVYALVAELYGRSTGCSRGRGGSMHLVDKLQNFLGTTAIVGNSIPIGVGSAAAIKANENNKEELSFIFFGDGAVEEGVFAESLNIAVLQELPAIFICENNSYSVYTHIKNRQPSIRKIHEWAKSFGVRSELLDLNNVKEAVENTDSLIHWARETRKPLFIEVATWREVEHCGPLNDDHLSYRSKTELAFWALKNQEKTIEDLVLSMGISIEILSEIKDKILSDIEYIFERVKLDPYEKTSDVFAGIYA